ncbi:MAG: glycosyltransferase, partial [Anaerolineales bacterium]
MQRTQDAFLVDTDVPASEYDLSVVVPVYNEEKNLSILYQELNEVLRDLGQRYELIFIDDGSADGSYAVLERLHAHDEHVKVIQFRRNFGQT